MWRELRKRNTHLVAKNCFRFALFLLLGLSASRVPAQGPECDFVVNDIGADLQQTSIYRDERATSKSIHIGRDDLNHELRS